MPSYMLRLPDDLLKKAKIAAIEAGLPLSEIVRELLMMWLSGKVKIKKAK
jgi:predicted DNA binding CopG/RHH family protein